MHAETILMPAKPSTKWLAVVSAVLFWCVPFSPLLSIVAVRATKNSTGWPRLVANTAALFTVAWVILLTLAVAWVLYVIVWNPALA